MEIEIKEMTIPELLFQFFEYKTGLDRADFDLIVVRSTGEKKKLPKSV